MSLDQSPPLDPRDTGATRERVVVRRAPKVWGFLALGAIAGVVAALALTFAFRPTDGGPMVTEDGTAFGLTQVFGFLLVCLVPIGAAVGAIVAIVLDRVLSRKAVEIDVDRIDVATPPGVTTDRDAADLPLPATPDEDSPRS